MFNVQPSTLNISSEFSVQGSEVKTVVIARSDKCGEDDVAISKDAIKNAIPIKAICLTGMKGIKTV
ncbi:MAG: hypothetical protein PVJ01_01385 [Pseudomonadota bacterium]|jgi:hypothetical protein